MYLQVKSTLTSSTDGAPGTMNTTEMPGSVTTTKPGLLVRLLDLLAEDRSADAEGHGPFNLIVAAGSGIETTGTFTFAVAAAEDQELDEHRAALARIHDAFPDSEIVQRAHALVPNREGALRDWIRTFSAKGYLIDEIVVGVAEAGDPEMVPVQVSLIDAPTGR